MNEELDKRADMDFQISLLTEHEVTRLITMVSAIAKKLAITEADHPEIEEPSKDVLPEEVLTTMERKKTSG